MPRRGLLGSIIICIASLTLAQTNSPSTINTQSKLTFVQTDSPSTVNTHAKLAFAQTDSPSTINAQDKLTLVQTDSPSTVNTQAKLGFAQTDSPSTINAQDKLTLVQTDSPSTVNTEDKLALVQTNSPSTINTQAKLAFARTDSPRTTNAQDKRPRLELEPRMNLNGGGFQLVSGSMTAGTGMEDDHLAWHVFGTYDAATKATYEIGNSPSTYAVISNPHGNIRTVGGSIYGRTSGGWLFGTEGSYSQLRTTDYTKVGWDIGVGGGHDWMHARCPTCSEGSFTSLRLTVEYSIPTHPGRPDTDNGFTAEFTVPSPIETDRHVFFNVHAYSGWICDPKCGTDGSASYGVLFRF
jgi:hypothetical protein